jgi:hypothetical protein
VLSYVQSEVEKQLCSLGTSAQEEVKDSPPADNDKEPLEPRWDLRRLQRALLFLYDEKETDRQCNCCRDYRQRLISGDLNYAYSEFRSHAQCVLVTMAVMFVCAFNVGLFMLAIPLVAAIWMTCVQRSVTSFDQTTIHKLTRFRSGCVDVCYMATLPGLITYGYDNSQLVDHIAEYVRDSGEIDMPITVLADVQHKTRAGAALNFALQCLYVDSTNIIAKAFECVPAVMLVLATAIHGGLIAERLTLLLKQFAPLLARIDTLGSQCRFRLDLRGVKLAERIVPLRPDDEGWQFLSTNDRNRFLKAFNDGSVKKMFERLEGDTTAGEEALTNALRHAQAAERRGSLQWAWQCLTICRVKVGEWISALNNYEFSYAQPFANTKSPMHAVISHVRGPLSGTEFLLLRNPMGMKILLCTLLTVLFGQFDWATLVVSAAVLYLRLELLLLFIKVCVVMDKGIWMSSNLFNPLQSSQMSQFNARNSIIKFLKSNTMHQPGTERAMIDSILVQ